MESGSLELVERTLEVDRKLRFRPGVGVFVATPDMKIVLGRRKTGVYDDGTWCLPGGGIEWGETIDDASIREALEECGMSGEYRGQLCAHTYMNLDHDSFHLTVYTVIVAPAGQTPEVCEPHKCYEWGLFDPLVLPSPLAYPDTAKAAERFYEWVHSEWGHANILYETGD